ncbi:MAG TPA: hypothetical protein VEJ23_07125, partial [Solirubrobacteraceae bacterium]|nr:hypothetical protein [Solirubrobacteraceae bacterium]
RSRLGTSRRRDADIVAVVWAWQRIRLLRAQPPARVKGERREVFASALEQAEQLMQAAAAIGPAARPLPLFYSLSQAGRAIAAAHLSDPWRLAGHGLIVPAKDSSNSLLRRVVKPDESDPPAERRHSFAGVAEATGSDSLTATVELGAIWAAIPDLLEPVPQMVSADTWRRPLHVYLTDWWGTPAPLAARKQFELMIDGLPDDPETMAGVLAHYPAAAGAVPKVLAQTSEVQRVLVEGQSGPVIVWPQFQIDWRQLETIAPAYWRGRLLLPSIGGDALSPLMLWWVLLFGLSSIARYDPELWIDALDVNRSKIAVPIEAALDVAIGALPELILAALTTP